MRMFSIIVPVYNLAPYLRECLDSVLSQTFTNWECMCIDDGSTDGSGVILDEYAAMDKRIHVIHQRNAGEGEARNTGLASAEGDWVFFLDGDDIMLPGALERLSKCASDDCSIVRFGFSSFEDGKGPNLTQLEKPLPPKIVDISHEIKMSEFYTYVWQHVYRRTLICDMKFKKYKRGCDRVFLDYVLLNRADSVKVVDDPCYGYRLRGGSAMNSQPSFQVLQDEMDHRIDIMEMIDASGKIVDYAGNYWLEGYFTHVLPIMTHERLDDASAIRMEWRMRLPRLLKCKGLSQKGKRYVGLSVNPILRPIGDCILFTFPCLRRRDFCHKLPVIKSVARLYRRIMRHGEFAR